MEKLFLNNVLLLGYTASEVVLVFYYSIIVFIFSAFCIILYRKIRPKFPIRVNCWFCNKNCLVPYNSRDCFDCPHCDQYNGFTKDGDYNVDIQKRMRSGNFNAFASEKLKAPTNGLCNSCNVNQQLRVQQLARFSPINSENYDEEIESFRTKLDNCYRLCSDCEIVLAKTLESQHFNLLANRMNEHRKFAASVSSHNSTFQGILRLKYDLSSKLKRISLGLLTLLILSSAANLGHLILADSLPFVIGHTLTDKALVILQHTERFLFGISILGTIFFLASIYGNPTRKADICIILWFITTSLSWFNYPKTLIAISLMTFYVHIQTFRPRTIYFTKKELPAKKTEAIFNVPIQTVPKEMTKLQDIINTANIKVSKNNDNSNDKENKSVGGGVLEDEKILKKTVLPQKFTLEPSRIQTRSQSAKKDETVLNEKKDERGRHYSPPPEVYEGLNNLHLTPINAEKSKRFSEMSKKNWNGLLKPATLVPSTPKAGIVVPSVTDDSEPSRSSTPCSSTTNRTFREPEKVLDGKYSPDINAYSCNKVSPYYSKFSTPFPYNVDYDFNLSNSMPPFYPNGFATPPYQMFAGPMGQTTVYTCTRPTPFPYNFHSQRFSPPFEYSSSPLSPRISEVGSNHSLSGNLFLSNVARDRWYWLKQTFYAASVIFNVVSVTVLIFSYWFGKIEISPVK